MNSNYNHIAFLCGHFKREKDVDIEHLEQFGWQRCDLSEQEKYKGKRYYYPEFIDFCHSSSFDTGCVRLNRSVEKSVSITVDVRGEFHIFTFQVKEITLYLFPQHMVLYSIRIEQDTTSLDDCSSLLYALRYIDAFETEPYLDFYHVAVQPIVQVYDALKTSSLQNSTQLVENGNKMRVFQVINAPANTIDGLDDEKKRHLLYKLATFSSITGKAIDTPSEDWQTTNKKCYVAVFDSWTALSMLDTFTILAADCESQIVNWVDHYFGQIYIQALFQKVCLFDFNNRFRHELKEQGNRATSKQVTALVKEFEGFERSCCFNRISYNFLPQLISDAISNSLEINDEMRQLYCVMAKERTRNEEASRKKMNSLLLAISFLTLFSAIWDACSMFNEMMSFKSHFGSTFWGFRIIGLIMAFVVIGVLVYLYRRKRGI
ncbi:MAG: hypothetical protein IKW85_01240 [Muribaculaceae bacterium]|nr:hypothetical protein [Muribaculaceae bacterium]